MSKIVFTIACHAILLLLLCAPATAEAAYGVTKSLTEISDTTLLGGTGNYSASRMSVTTARSLTGTGSSSVSDGFYSLETIGTVWDGTVASRTIETTTDSSGTYAYTYTYGDESSIDYTLPWPFNFYGTNYAHITVDTNGNIWFGSAGPAHSFNLASAGYPVIAAWNNDLSSYYYGGVFIQHKSNPERIVVEWQTETWTEEGYYLPNNFAVVLYLNGAIRIDYKSFATNYGQDYGSGIAKGDGSSSVLNLTTLIANVSTLAGNSFLFTSTAMPGSYPLNLNVTGTGNGYVTSTPEGIACNVSCSSSFPVGDNVTLHPAPSQYSLFTGWTNGICSGTGDCLLTLYGETTVTAVFDRDTAHRVTAGDSGNPAYYATIQESYNAVPDGGTIRTWAEYYDENLVCSRPVSVAIQGGFNAEYSGVVGETIVRGSLTITDGNVEIEGLMIQ
jgi:hypothetical protein